MKPLIRVVLIVLLFVVNLAIAEPSLADRPKVTKNPDYVELTKTLNSLLAEKEGQSSKPGLQQKIDELQIQKAAMESGVAWGQCRNETGKTLAIYGPKAEQSKSSVENELYFLADGESTPEGWDCNGIYLPNGAKVAGVDVTEAVAYKVLDGTRLVVKTNPETGEMVLNSPPVNIFKAGEKNWSIPNISQAFIESRIPNTLAAGEIDD
jgi:hypothetical protein